MRLEGWSQIPDGYGASFDVRSAPLWLRAWFCTPLLDRFAYPRMVKRGFGYLTLQPGVAHEDSGDVGEGWRIRHEANQPPGSVADLR